MGYVEGRCAKTIEEINNFANELLKCNKAVYYYYRPTMAKI
jgi:hypothetical protein